MLQGLGCFKHARQGFCVVTLCRGRENDRDFYAFIAIEPHNYAYFRRRYRDGQTSNFRPYGFELLRGWGSEPPPEVLEYVRLKYGVEFNVSESFLSRLAEDAQGPADPLSREWYLGLGVATGAGA